MSNAARRYYIRHVKRCKEYRDGMEQARREGQAIIEEMMRNGRIQRESRFGYAAPKQTSPGRQAVQETQGAEKRQTQPGMPAWLRSLSWMGIVNPWLIAGCLIVGVLVALVLVWAFDRG